MVAGFRDLPLRVRARAQFSYNNSGYFLSGMRLEKVTGQAVRGSVLQRQIFTPLGMSDSGYDSRARILPLRASGYSRRGPEPRRTRPTSTWCSPSPRARCIRPVDDLLKWDQALYTDKLLPAARQDDDVHARSRATTPTAGNVRQPSPQTFGRQQVAHGGGINGFSTSSSGCPRTNITSIVLANVQQAQTGRIARDLLAILFGEPYKAAVARTVANVDPKMYDAYVGQVSAHADVHPDGDAGRRSPHDAGDRSVEARGLSGVGDEVSF